MSRQVQPLPKGKKRPRKPSTRGLKNKAIELHSRYVRARDGRCVRCGRYDNLQCAHMVRRTYAATVTDELNARALCGGCHIFIDSHHFEAVVFWTEQWGSEHYAAMRAKAYAGTGKVMRAAFWEGEIARLTVLLEEAA